jgi:hypothetical protein
VVDRDQNNVGDRHGFISFNKVSNTSGEAPRSNAWPGTYVSEVSHLNWGHWYILRDFEIATNGALDENVIGAITLFIGVYYLMVAF